MTETKPLPTLGKNKHFCNCCQGEAYAVLLAHEQFYEVAMVKAGKKLVEEQFKDSITFAKNKERFDQLKGSRNAIRGLRGKK